jgi:hypothetical protein
LVLPVFLWLPFGAKGIGIVSFVENELARPDSLPLKRG